MLLQAKIDPKSYQVSLIDLNGGSVSKDDLSAGEKQIFALAMLSALGKTSGRNLPVMIDTPLGRLDSLHRKKIIDNYFPYASHQVIILSTDTEVDENYYSQLNKHISKAFHLTYNIEHGKSDITNGYFWKNKEVVA